MCVCLPPASSLILELYGMMIFSNLVFVPFSRGKKNNKIQKRLRWKRTYREFGGSSNLWLITPIYKTWSLVMRMVSPTLFYRVCKVSQELTIAANYLLTNWDDPLRTGIIPSISVPYHPWDERYIYPT